MVSNNDDVMFVSKSLINDVISKLEREFLGNVDEDYLRRLINEYRNLKRNIRA